MKKEFALNQEFVTLIISLVIFLVTFPAFVPDYGPGLDPSYIWAVNYLFVFDYQVLTSLTYPIGPLGFLKYVAAFEHNLAYGLLFFSMVKLGFLYVLLTLSIIRNGRITIMSFLLVLVISVFSGLDYSLVGITVGLLILFAGKPGKPVLYLLANAIALLGLVVKSSIGLSAYAAIFMFLVYQLIQQNISLKKLASLLLLSLVIFIPGGAIVFNGFASFYHFLIGLTHLAGGYSSGLALFPDNNWWYLSGFILSVLSFPLIAKKKNDRLAFVILLLPLFATWKHAMGREDASHILALLNFLFVFWGIILINSKKLSYLYFIFPLAGILFFGANMRATKLHHGYNFNLNGLTHFNEAVLNYPSFNGKYKSLSAENIKVNRLDESVLNDIGQLPIDIYPWDISYVPANTLNWKTRPTLELGASTSQWLSHKSASAFLPENAPEYVLVHMNNDKWGGRLGSIDGRYLLNDEPVVMYNLLRNYTFKSGYNRMFLLKKEIKDLSKQELQEEITGWNKWVIVPQGVGLTRLKVVINKSMLLKLKAFLYKDEGFYIDYQLKDGRLLSYRFIASTAQDGLWINPLVLNPGLNSYLQVEKVRFRSTSDKLLKPDIQLNWESIPVRLDSFFGRQNDAAEKTIVKNLWNFETKDDEQFIQESADKYAGNYSARISAGAFSFSIKVGLDTLWKNDFKEIKIQSGLMYRYHESSTDKASLVVTVKGSDDDFWMSFPMTGAGSSDEWKYAFVSRMLTSTLHNKGELSIYVWNNGNSDVLIDDVEVKIMGVESE